MTKLLSKSKYKLAISCPTKLYYASNTTQYPNSNDENDFLQSLAEGGYQIGKFLASGRCFHRPDIFHYLPMEGISTNHPLPLCFSFSAMFCSWFMLDSTFSHQ